MPAGNHDHEGKELRTWLFFWQVAFSHLLWTLQLAKAADPIGGTGQNLVSVLVSEGYRSWGEEESSAWQHNNLMVKYLGLSLTWP